MNEPIECGQCYNELDPQDADGDGRLCGHRCDAIWYIWEIDVNYKNRDAWLETQPAQGDEGVA